MIRDFKRIIYAIYPLDSDGNIAGVYVGMTRNLRQRIKGHMNDRHTENQMGFHSLMRDYGFYYQILENVEEYPDRRHEYDWIDYFKHMGVPVFNAQTECFSPDYRRVEMAVKHILRDGTVLDDITGHVVKMEDARVVYELLDKINQERGEKNDTRNGD